MQISSLTLPKDRYLRAPNDDTILMLPGVLAVFDGATSPQTRKQTGSSSGRIASQAAAHAVAEMALAETLIDLPPAAIFDPISARIRDASQKHGMEGKPSTTMSLAVFGPEEVRFVAVGDSGIRINGARLVQKTKLIDEVSKQSRLAVYPILSQRHDDPDQVEKLARFVIFEGYAEALSQGLMTPGEVAQIRDALFARFTGQFGPDSLGNFLDLGIRSQFRFANQTDDPLGYSTLNTDPTSLADIIDFRVPRADLDSIELFTDGYFQIPRQVSLEEWERAFIRTEAEDFHKLHRFANVKGSTSCEFSDDRSIIIAKFINGISGGC